MSNAVWTIFEKIWVGLPSGRPADADIDRFDCALRDAGIDNWEVGPHDAEGKVSFIALTPDDDGSNRAIPERLIADFPGFPGWIACLFRPPKHWKRRWRTKRGGTLIDANFWRVHFCSAETGGLRAIVLMERGWLSSEREALNLAAFFIEAEMGGRFMADALMDIQVMPLDSDIDMSRSPTLDAVKAKWVP